MSGPIDWGKLTPGQRVFEIIAHVLKWRWDGMEPHILTYPVTFYDERSQCWYAILALGQQAQKFDPLHNLADAWKIVEQVGETTVLTYHPARIGDDSTCSACYSCDLGEDDLYYGMYHPSRAYAETAAEAVCIAALRHACQHVINTTKEQIVAYLVTFEDGTHMIYQEKEHAMEAYHQREQYLKDNLQWAMQIRKLRMEEVQVPADYFDGGVAMA